jgi:hypothetical protein
MQDLETQARRSIELRAEVDALALKARTLTGAEYTAATKRWWELVREMQQVNAELRDSSLAQRIVDDHHRTQRRMVAALFWRAGDLRERARQHFPGSDAWRFYMGDSDAIRATAHALFAVLPVEVPRG